MATSSIHKWLKDKTYERGATLRQVAAYSGISPSTLVHIMKGRCVPTPATCYKLADYFKVDADLLLETQSTCRQVSR